MLKYKNMQIYYWKDSTMREKNDYITVSQNDEQISQNVDLITNANYGLSDTQGDFKISKNGKYKLEDSNVVKTIKTHKWQIVLTSPDCSIKEHCQGWQVRKSWIKKSNRIFEYYKTHKNIISQNFL